MRWYGLGVAKALSRSGCRCGAHVAGMVPAHPLMAPSSRGRPNIDARATSTRSGDGVRDARRPTSVLDLAPHRMLAAHVVDPVTPVAQHRPDAPPQLADLVMRCLHKDPARRPQTAGEVRDALATADGTPETAVARRRTRGPVFAALGLGVAAVAAWLAFQSRPSVALDPTPRGLHRSTSSIHGSRSGARASLMCCPAAWMVRGRCARSPPRSWCVAGAAEPTPYRPGRWDARRERARWCSGDSSARARIPCA